ncbi:FAD-binding oxidoreductase [Microbaculum marinum]|uniref:FAD-binding oxidoreductase n=1 Tax=Microbaculum marinum TaxID=1764581 RepID=A0AAW9RL19_9HYPH
MTAERDIVVIGAGIVGVSAAIHLQKRGRSVTLVDRRDPGEETSYGNTGVIEGGTYVPIAMPRDVRSLLRYARNMQPEMHFHWGAMPKVAPWLMQLAANSSEAKLRANGGHVMALLAHAIDEHKALLSAAGAERYLRETGWIRIYRSEAAFQANALERRIADEGGFGYDVLDPEEVRELEPHLNSVFARAEHWHDVASLSDPGAVTKAYAAQFAADGGSFERTATRRLTPSGAGWTIETDGGSIAAREVVVALGPWSMDLLTPLGYRVPFAVKRGYHTHYRPKGNASLVRPIVDVSYGYAMSPMTLGIRVTTGIEFADRDAPPTPVQVSRIEPHVRELIPLGEPVEDSPWMGRRPSFPDSLPAIGPAPNHAGLWLDFGHAHLGLTLGPVSGRLLAEMICGEATVVDPAPYSVTRFG